MAEKPRTMAMIETILSFAIPTASSTGRMRCETAGSPTQPSARDATVIPTWQTEIGVQVAQSLAYDRGPSAAFLF